MLMDMCAGSCTQPPLAYTWATSPKCFFLTQWSKSNSLTVYISRELFPHEMFHHQNIYYTSRAWQRRKIHTWSDTFLLLLLKKKITESFILAEAVFYLFFLIFF